MLSHLETYARGDTEARRLSGGIQAIAHLFDEDVYLLARQETKEIGDLVGRGCGGLGAPTPVYDIRHVVLKVRAQALRGLG